MVADAESPDEKVAMMVHDFKTEYETPEGRKTRSKDKRVLPEEAQRSYKACDYNGALGKFVKYLAALSLDKKMDPETEASMYANIASCLHHLEDFDLAKKYYVKALELFEGSCSTGTMIWLMYGDVNQRRVDYVKARVGLLSLSQTPDKSKYLDGYGKERQWSHFELGPEGREFGYLDYPNPLSWYRFYTAVPTNEL